MPRMIAGTEGNCIGQATELEAIPRSPGADARYIVNFKNGKTLLPEQDGIVFRVDAQIDLPEKIKADEIDIHYTLYNLRMVRTETPMLLLDPARPLRWILPIQRRGAVRRP